MTDRPKRRAIPVRIKRQIIAGQKVCPCGCGLELTIGLPTHWDHEPALRLRNVNRRRTDYIPKQHDRRYIVGRCVPSHKVKTHGTGATTAGTDIGKISKERRRSRKPRFKRPIPSRPMQSSKTRWPKQKLQSRPFQRRKK